MMRSTITGLPAAVVLLVASAITMPAAGQVTRYVDADNCPGPGSGFPWDPYCAIQTAIGYASDGDEIEVAPGTYFETINFFGKAVTLRSADGPELTIIARQGRGRVVTCHSGEGPDTVLDGFTITGGSSGEGGGMYNEYSSPTVINCTFEANTAYAGGGMFNSASSPTVTNCTFAENVADEGGGGMWNTAWCTPKVTDCSFSENTANNFGGGIANKHGGDAEVTNCTFMGNSAAAGGGMSNTWASRPTVTNCTFSGNTASYYGGGMYNYLLSGPTLTNCTFSGNTALGGGGAMHHASNEPWTVANCVCWSNTPNEIGVGGIGPIVTYSDVQGSWPGTGNIDSDPRFVDPETGDYRLLPGSPCIDAGDNTEVPDGITTDLDGNRRFVDDPDTVDTGVPGNGYDEVVDLGAYEFQLCPCDCEDAPDRTVDAGDFLALLAQWGGAGSCDCENPPDGTVDAGDFLALLGTWGPCP